MLLSASVNSISSMPSRRVLVLLVLGDEIVHVTLCLSELHLIHALPRVPMQEGLAAEHGREELGYPLEHLLDGGGIPGKSHCHLQSFRRDVADTCLDVVWNP